MKTFSHNRLKPNKVSADTLSAMRHSLNVSRLLGLAMFSAVLAIAFSASIVYR